GNKKNALTAKIKKKKNPYQERVHGAESYSHRNEGISRKRVRPHAEKIGRMIGQKRKKKDSG
ncbi:MAG: hypothetical protein NTW33_02835, partial [Methanoregula sp.]|nr:hypothetical protein [Methanoregula sp.]